MDIRSNPGADNESAPLLGADAVPREDGGISTSGPWENHNNPHDSPWIPPSHRISFDEALREPEPFPVDDYNGDDTIASFEDKRTIQPHRTQSSFVTILSLWTTMMGSTLLVMPWAIAEAGFALGIILVFTMGALAFYPTTLIYKASDYIKFTLGEPVVEFQDICSRLLGPKTAWISLLISLLNLIGAMVVYWILMSSMLYQIGCFIYENRYPELQNITDSTSFPYGVGLFSEYWNELLTVPFYLVFLLLPLICLKNPTFFTKFSSFGIVSVLFMVIFVILKAWIWGLHITTPDSGFKLANEHFPALTGTLSMGFFIHNCILSMTTHHRHPEKRVRDTGIAFLLVAVCYTIVGALFYAAFPANKSTISDNFLKDFSNKEVLALGARCLLLFQMITVFPLLAYLFRVQLFYAVFKRLDLSHHFVIILNVVLVGVCIVFASLYPRIGDILRILGAICGLVYVFTLPLLLDLAVCARTNRRSWIRTTIYAFLILIGLSNFIAQFIIPLHKPSGFHLSLK